MAEINKRRIGQTVEEMVCRYLADNSVNITERNYRCRSGEIDIIGKDGDYLVFFEVKYRKNSRYGTALEAVNRRKQLQICRVYNVYSAHKHLPVGTKVRFDVVGVDDDKITWIKNAFSYGI